MLCLQCMAIASAYAASACHVDVAGATPAGCMATPAWSGHGEFEPAILNVVDGGQYARPGSGLYIYNSNTTAPAGNSGTRGIYAYGQSSAAIPTPTSVDIGGSVPITLAATNVYNPTANEGVYASTGAQIRIAGSLNVTTSTTAPTYRARAVVANGIGVGALANTPSRITVNGTLEADTTQAAQTPFAVEATDGGQISAHGGSIASARSGLLVRASGSGSVDSRFTSAGATQMLQAGGNGVTVESASNANAASVRLDNANITAHDSGLHLHNGGALSSTILYQQGSGSITSTHSSAIAFTGGIGKANVDLIDTAVVTTSPSLGGGVDADYVTIGYAVVSGSGAANRLHMNGGSIKGHILTDNGAKLWLDASGTVWDTAGNPNTANSNSLTGMSGAFTIQMPDIRDTIYLQGNDAGLGAGCGNGNLTLVVPTNQSAPPASPHPVMVCKNAAAAPTMALQGGSVVLEGFQYTLQTVPDGARMLYQLVRGAATPTVPPNADVTNVPTLSQWGMIMLSCLLGLTGVRRRIRAQEPTR